MEVTFLVLLIFAVCASSSEDPCAGCPHKHPQQHFCDSLLARKIKIKTEERESADIPNMKRYTAEIIQNWKRGPSEGEFEFYVPVSICGSSFDVGETYVITGSKEITEDGQKYWLHGSCDYKSVWDHMPKRQRMGFKKDYKNQCEKCSIKEASAPSDVLVEDIKENDYSKAATYWTPTGCFYNPQKTQYYINRPGSEVEECEDLYGFCRRNRETGGCQWELTDEYEACFKYRDEFVIVDSGKFAITDESQCDVYTNKRKKKRCQENARIYKDLEMGTGESILYF